MSKDRIITLRKYLAASVNKDEEGRTLQILASSIPTRDKDGTGFRAVDGLWVSGLLPDLKFEENAIEVDLTVSLDKFEGGREMWCFSRRIESRGLTPFKPTLLKTGRNGCDTYRMKQGDMYLDNFTRERYFEQIEAGEIFPVWVSVKRVQPETVDSSENNH